MLESEENAPNLQVVDLGVDEMDERQEVNANEPLLSTSSSSRCKKRIITAVVVVLCLSGVISLTVWQVNKASIVPPIPTTPRPGPPQIPTVRPLPQTASNLTAEELLVLVFDKDQLDYIQVKCLPQSPPTFKFILQVGDFSNFTGESNSYHHAKMAVSREAAESMFGLDYTHKLPIPPPPQACQLM